MNKIIFILLFVPMFIFSQATYSETQDGYPFKPKNGDIYVVAHCGAIDTHPENTIAAFEEEIRLGAHMIEFDVRMTKDKKLVIMHDKTVDRTTNGSGVVSDFTLEKSKSLDAGSWKSKEFAGEKVPTFKEALAVMPPDIWLNIHLKGGEDLGKATAKVLNSAGCIHQGVIACVFEARGVKKVDPNIMICNMERKGNIEEYVEETIDGKFPFIQLLKNEMIIICRMI